MKPYQVPLLTRGLDLVADEASLPKGSVRRATNITMHDSGCWQSRGGYAAHIALEGAHSFWRSAAQTRVMVAADDTLYGVDLAHAAAGVLFTGLPLEQPVEYCDVGPDVYFTCAGVLRRITDTGQVRRPGVADLAANAPTLGATVGSLAPGRYGVAYGLINDLGEESGTSAIAWIVLDATGGLLVSGLPTGVPDAVSVVIYASPPDAGELYRYAVLPVTSATSITDRTLGRLCARHHRAPMPGGDIVRLYRGRLYVARGRWVYVSDPLDYGVYDLYGGWLTFNRTITVMEPVRDGIFFGLRERTLLLRGQGPGEFEQVAASDIGAIAHTGIRVPADYFNADVAPQRDEPCAAWLSPRGLAVGRPDGSISYPQANRLLLEADGGRAWFMQHEGTKQAVFNLQSLSLGVGGAVDATI